MNDGVDFDIWYRQNGGDVVAAIHLFCGDHETAVDCAGEAAVRALERWDRVSQMASPTGWVVTVGMNLARRNARRLVSEAKLLRRSPPPEASPFKAVEHSAVWDAVRDLPKRQRQVVALKYVAGLTEATIAELLQIAPGTVAATLHQARNRLRDQLNLLGYEGVNDVAH